MTRGRAERGLRTGFLVGSAVLALASLPTLLFDPRWLVTFIAPAIALHLLITRTSIRSSSCLLLSVSVFVLLLWGATVTAPPLTRVTALGCTLVPPLAFLTARRWNADVLRALFLAVCVFLIGAILGNPSGPHCMVFLGCAIGTLYFDTRVGVELRRHSWRGRALRLREHLSNLAVSVVAALVVCLLCVQLLRTLPAPSTEREANQTPAAPAARRLAQVGLSTNFDLDDSAGGLLNLRADEILRVETVEGRALPPRLYLRCSHFDRAGIDRWRAERIRLQRSSNNEWPVHRPARGVRIEALGITLLEPQKDFVFLPPGTFHIVGLPGLLGNRRRDYFRLPGESRPGLSYSVAYQDVSGEVEDSLTDPAFHDLTELRELGQWSQRFAEILRHAEVENEIDPIKMARAIARVIQARCEYSLRGPTGPYRHALLNFLDGDRRGFCMHFASLTAICLRLAGVPCRIGVGLCGGTPDPERPHVRHFGSRDAHAWVEIPFEGYGWVVFDPTPAADLERARSEWISDDLAGAASDGGDEVADAGDDSRMDDAIRLFGEPLRYPFLWIALVSLLAISLFRRHPTRSAGKAKAVTPPEALTARRLLEKLLHVLGRIGHRRPRQLTLEKYARDLRRSDELPLAEIDAALRAYQDVRFGGRTFDAQKRDAIERALAASREYEQARKEQREAGDRASGEDPSLQ